MKILYLITRADLGGAQVHLLDVLKGLPGRVDPTVAVGEEGFFAEAVRDLGVACLIVPSLTQPIAPGKDLRALFETYRLIRERKPDLVHAHTSKAGVIGRFAARWAGVPSVFTAHTWCFAEGTSWKWKLAGVPCERLAAWCGSAIINVSDANRKIAERYGIANRARILTIHNGVADVIPRATPESYGTPTIAVIARCVPQKDQSLLLRALASIHCPWRAVFVGDGPTRPALEAEASRLEIGARLEFLGERREVAEILSRSHIFALPTRWEGFPLTILEAMRAGLPVIASNVGGVAEAVLHGETGFLVPCGDQARLSARLRDLIDSPALRRQLGHAGRLRYETEFTIDAMLRKTLALYEEILPGAPTAESLSIREVRARVH